jgi:hypothetical protein
MLRTSARNQLHGKSWHRTQGRNDRIRLELAAA